MSTQCKNFVHHSPKDGQLWWNVAVGLPNQLAFMKTKIEGQLVCLPWVKDTKITLLLLCINSKSQIMVLQKTVIFKRSSPSALIVCGRRWLSYTMRWEPKREICKQGIKTDLEKLYGMALLWNLSELTWNIPHTYDYKTRLQTISSATKFKALTVQLLLLIDCPIIAWASQGPLAWGGGYWAIPWAWGGGYGPACCGG